MLSITLFIKNYYYYYLCKCRIRNLFWDAVKNWDYFIGPYPIVNGVIRKKASVGYVLTNGCETSLGVLK